MVITNFILYYSFRLEILAWKVLTSTIYWSIQTILITVCFFLLVKTETRISLPCWYTFWFRNAVVHQAFHFYWVEYSWVKCKVFFGSLMKKDIIVWHSYEAFFLQEMISWHKIDNATLCLWTFKIIEFVSPQTLKAVIKVATITNYLKLIIVLLLVCRDDMDQVVSKAQAPP